MPPSWKVVSVTTGQIRGTNGQFGPAWVVSYQTEAGGTGQVTIAKSDYTLDAVKALIEADAGQMAEIHGLSG